MVGKLIKQPNDKYCIVRYGEGVSKYNLTEQDIIDMYIEDAKACIGAAGHFSNIIKETVSSGYEEKLNRISDDVLKEMGFDNTYDELLIFVPRKPKNTSYYGRDCTTYGNCPNCEGKVSSGMGGTDKQCRKCGQILNWSRY